MNQGMDKKDYIFYALSCGIALLVIAGVYLYAYLAVPGDYVFSGFICNSHDGYSYQIYANHSVLQGGMIDNAWALTRQPPAYFNLIWYLLGRAVAIGIPFIVAYHALQVVAGAVMCLAILALMRQMFRDRVMAWCAYLISSFGAGFGWLIQLCFRNSFGGKLISSDILNGDSFPVTCLWTQPHMVVSHAMLVGIYLLMYLAAIRNRRSYAFFASAIALAMGFSHPYHFVTILPVLFVWHLIMTIKHGKSFIGRWVNMAVLFCCMLPGLLYYRHFIATSPNFSYWAGSNVIRTPGLLPVLLGFGFIFLLAIFGLRLPVPFRKYSDRYLFVIVWLPINFAMHFSYPVFFFEAKLGEGLIFPLSILATWVYLGYVVPFLGRRTGDPSPESDVKETQLQDHPDDAAGKGRMKWVLVLLILTLPTTGFNVANMLHELTTGQPYLGFTLNTRMKVHKAERQALEFLSHSAAADFPLVLAGPDSGLIIPAYAPVRAYFGHVTNTTNLQERLFYLRKFYAPQESDEYQRAFLKRFDISYVWWGSDEDYFGGQRPQNVPYMTPIFNNGYITIYKVNKNAL